jgi:ribosomal protein L32
MKCVVCKQEQTQAGLVTVTLEREGALASGQSLTIVVFKRVPADVCENCGEYYLSDEVTGELLERAEEAITSGAEVEIRRHAA